jgi:hypothetical protein
VNGLKIGEKIGTITAYERNQVEYIDIPRRANPLVAGVLESGKAVKGRQKKYFFIMTGPELPVISW